MTVKTIVKTLSTLDSNIKDTLEEYITSLKEQGELISYNTISDEVNKRVRVVARVGSGD